MNVIVFLVFSLFLFFAFTYFVPLNLWVTASLSGVKIDLSELVFMRVRKSPVKEIVLSMIALTKAGVTNLKTQDLEVHALAGGNVEKITKAVIKAHKEDIKVDFKELSAMDLAGKNLDDFLYLRKNQGAEGYKEKRAAIANKVFYQLTDQEIDELETFLSKYGAY